MQKNVVIGLVILVAVIGAGIGWKVFQDSSKKAAASKIEYLSKPKPLSVTGVSGYTLDKVDLGGEQVPVIRIPLVTWGGYAALFAANGGVKPSKDSLFYKYGKFAVEIIDIEDPAEQLAGYASGKYPIIWSTMDMLPLMYDALKIDHRVIPQVFGVFDWSFGGDGIVVRNISSPKELKGKRIVVSGNTPSNFFLLWLLAQAGLKPSDVVIQYVSDAVAAKDAYVGDKRIDACVTWSPFIYEITDPNSKTYVEGSKLLITSKDANQLIADCYLSRLDFAKDHPEILRAFNQAMMEGVDLLQTSSEKVFQQMGDLFKLPGGANDSKQMLGDVHIANFPENQMFFDLDNPISAYKIFFLSQEYYKEIGALADNASYDAEAVIYLDSLKALKDKGLFAKQENTVKNSFNKQGSFNIADLETKKTVLAEDVQISFDAQRIDFDFDSSSQEVVENKQHLQKIAEQMEVLGTTVVKLIGHLDTTKVEEFKAQGAQIFIEASAQAKLISKKRAEFIKKLLVERYKADPQRIITEGKGWDQPLDPTDQNKNRRVEVRFLSFE
jgi:ABC-type nitrate/sulfonate/bicarbonate transport system substrate-binding protein